MDYRKVIEGQIELLTKTNKKLADQDAIEAAREIRENALAIATLARNLEKEMPRENNSCIEDLETRIELIEDLLYGREWEQEEAKEYYNQDREEISPIFMLVRDTDDEISSIVEWMKALEKHLGLEEGWDELAGA